MIEIGGQELLQIPALSPLQVYFYLPFPLKEYEK
jgi:hypothetical protein